MIPGRLEVASAFAYTVFGLVRAIVKLGASHIFAAYSRRVAGQGSAGAIIVLSLSVSVVGAPSYYWSVGLSIVLTTCKSTFRHPRIKPSWARNCWCFHSLPGIFIKHLSSSFIRLHLSIYFIQLQSQTPSCVPHSSSTPYLSL